ncbi:hypothetical protein ABZX40_23410 [Streptomyces sp. NPDC004610]|uniref:hypothetical protein n=1 Tax=unclassified Streptomyces TaxID=2593676 RepID=UPI0033BEB1B7
MRKRLVRKMFRGMAEGGPVRLTVRFAGLRTMARLALLAEQFGYRYVDASQGREEMFLFLQPDPSPEGLARAAENRARYPDAATGGPRPPLVDKDVALFRMRIEWDLQTGLSDRVRLLLWCLLIVPTSAAIMFRFQDHPTVVAVTGISCGVLFVVPVLFGVYVLPGMRARQEARMVAAGFVRVTDPDGRPRYVPADPHLQAPGNPFAVGR